MTRYDKMAGTPERFADFFIKIYDRLDDETTQNLCKGMCVHCLDSDINCTDENLKKCVLEWLEQEG